ncbi:MAG: CPBP family intramembrane glutamic endopeptidase [Patescibacteria group bacterium]
MNWLQPLVEVTILGLVPLVLINTGLIKGAHRFGVLAAAGLLMVADVVAFHIPAYSIGIRTDNLADALPWFVGLVVIAVCFIILIARLQRITPIHKWWQDPHFRYLFIPISIGQQFVFFGFIQSRLQEFIPTIITIIASALIFASAHLMYRPRRQAFLVTFAAGIGFAACYAIAPNLIIGSVAHMMLNVTAVQRNLFSFPKNQE